MDGSFEVVIIGGGPAGLSAGIYATRSRLNALLVEKMFLGGQIANAEVVENYPGFPDGISGAELGSLMANQAQRWGLQTAIAEVQRLELNGAGRSVLTTEGRFDAKTVIVAGGTEHRKLGVPGEDQYLGKGVSYCAMCDGAFFRDQPVAVVGGGNVALYDALFLARFASKVIVIHRRDQLRATKILQERAFEQAKIEFLWDTVVDSVEGDGKVGGLALRDVRTGSRSDLAVAGVFVAVGLRPNTGFCEGLLDLTPEGFVKVNANMETGVPGIYAAGDIRSGSPRQVVCAVGDGAIAAISAENYLAALV